VTVGALDSWDGHDTGDLARAWGVPLVEAWASIGSTNDHLARLAREGAADWTVVVATEQTEGRGRRGAAWQSAPGAGLWMSVLIPVHAPELPLPLIIGAASAVAIESLVPDLDVWVKWPNDLLVRPGRVGRMGKVGGVLCEVRGGRVIAGVGINLRAPEGGFVGPVAKIAASLEERSAKELTRSDLARVIISRVRTLMAAPDPWGQAASTLASRDALSGERVETELEGTGVAAGIDDTGALILERDDGVRVRVVSGSVRLLER
jgi:BirA family transcriptional regulator, biotin operon repressor / biotin---[acetyl-CoA-carboxylase] ligase